MNSLDEIMSNIDQFEHNIKEIASVIEALHQINNDYEKSTNATKKVIAKIEEINVAQEEELKKIIQDIGKMLFTIKEYDVLIETGIKKEIQINLESI